MHFNTELMATLVEITCSQAAVPGGTTRRPSRCRGAGGAELRGHRPAPPTDHVDAQHAGVGLGGADTGGDPAQRQSAHPQRGHQRHGHLPVHRSQRDGRATFPTRSPGS